MSQRVEPGDEPAAGPPPAAAPAPLVAGDGTVALPAFASATRPWWEQIQGRLEYECQALQDAGIPFEPDEASFGAGVARLHVHPMVDGERLDLIVTFPDLYPYFRFTVESPQQLGLTHHQAPFGTGALCLLGRDTGEWRTCDTVAGLLQEQLPRTLAAGRLADRAAAVEIEEQQAEPLSYWYPYAPAMLLIDSAWRIPRGTRFGEFRGRLTGTTLLEEGQVAVRGIVTQVLDERRNVIAQIDTSVAAGNPGQDFTGRWAQSSQGIATVDPKEFFEEAEALDRRGAEPPWVRNMPRPMASDEFELQLRGVMFPEEHAHRDATGQGWTFVVRSRRRRRPPAPMPSNSKFIRGPRQVAPQSGKVMERFVFVRAGRAGRGDLVRRVPELHPLRDARVLVVGLGCLGAPSALEFARTQVAELRVVDDDVVDPGTVARWPFGLSSAGVLKAQAIRDFITRDYPYTKVIAEARKLGAVRSTSPSGAEAEESDFEVLERVAADSSLIYDASAEFGVHHFLSEYARERRIPYIAVAGTQGGWGGRVVRIRPGVTEGCWVCLQSARAADAVPEPPENVEGRLQTEGCADPTFTAAGFDMVSVAMQGVRLAVSTLCAGAPGAYPDVHWDVAVMSFRDRGGRIVAPIVETLPLRRHPACPACARREA